MRAPRLAARLSAAVLAAASGATLRSMTPFTPWWGDVALLVSFAAMGWWGVRTAERLPGATPRAQVFAGARWIALAGLLVVGFGFAVAASARAEMAGLLGFAFLTLGALLVAVAAGGVAIGCATARVVIAMGDPPPRDALDHLAARVALWHGLAGALLLVAGRGSVVWLGLAESLAAVAVAAVAWGRDGARLAWVERVKAGREPPWRWETSPRADAPRWSAADDATTTAAIARGPEARAESPFRDAPAEPLEAWSASEALTARLRARRWRAAAAAGATLGALGLAALVYRSVAAHSFPEGTVLPARVRSLGGDVARARGANGGVCVELDGDPTPRCWGNNAWRFPGTHQALREPTALDALRGLRGLSLAYMHACALRGDGRVACWGQGGDGRLGANGEDASSPRPVAGVDHVAQVAVGGAFSCALRRDGSAWCWGCSPLRSRTDPGGCAVYAPERVANVPAFAELAAGEAHACGRTEDGAVWCWGAVGAVPSAPDVFAIGPQPPRRVPLEAPARAIFAGPYGGFALDARGRAWWWGDVRGLDRPPGVVPGGVAELPLAVASVSQAADGGCALLRDGAVACWGDNGRGQRGLGHRSAVAGVTRVPGVAGMRGVTTADGGACAWGPAGVVCWGSMGQE